MIARVAVRIKSPVVNQRGRWGSAEKPTDHEILPELDDGREFRDWADHLRSQCPVLAGAVEDLGADSFFQLSFL